MKYLVMADINTDEEYHKIELTRVKNIAVFSGEKINTIGTWFGCCLDKNKKYFMVQYDIDSFFVGEVNEVYICFVD